MPSDKGDFTDKYNTKLTPAQEQQFLAEHPDPKDSYDYDMRGAWLSGATKASNGHLPDTFKKPNHPTFSDESQYSGKDGYVGGKWTKQLGPLDSWLYTASPTNLQFRSGTDLNTYFKTKEPNSTLLLAPVAPQTNMQ